MIFSPGGVFLSSSDSCSGARYPLARLSSLALSAYSKIQYSEWPPESPRCCSSYLSPQEVSAVIPQLPLPPDPPPAAAPRPKCTRGAWEASPFARSALCFPAAVTLWPKCSKGRKQTGFGQASLPRNPALLQAQHRSPPSLSGATRK